MTLDRDQLRRGLSLHPTAKHTWAKPDHLDDREFFDELPMDAEGEMFEPTGRPRHSTLSDSGQTWPLKN